MPPGDNKAPKSVAQSQELRRKALIHVLALIVCSTLYSAVFFNTLHIHNVFTRPFRQLYGPGPRFLDKGEHMIAKERTFMHTNNERNIEVSKVGPNKKIGEDEITDASGEHITSILMGEIPFAANGNAQRLQFQPGTLKLTQSQTLQYCYVDPTVYQMHYPSADRQVTSVSNSYKVVYLMIPKSGSSTGRWIMDNVLGAHDIGMDPTSNELYTEYKDHTVIIFARDPLSRFYSQYDEIFLRYGPWMKARTGKAWEYAKKFQFPYPYFYENMNEWQDFQDAFCPPDSIPDDVYNAKNWCSKQQTQENGTLATRFKRFVQDYDGLSPWDLHLHLQVPHISNKHTGRPRRVDEVYSTKSTIHDWKYIVEYYGQSLPENGKYGARSIPRRFNPSLVSIETKRRICQLSAIDYCCLNLDLPPECRDEDIDVYCSLDKNDRGEFRIQPWNHPNEV